MNKIEMGDCPLCHQTGTVSPDCLVCNGSGSIPVAAGGIARARKATESNPIVRFVDGKQTRSSAIKAKCCECMGCTYEAVEPGFRALVRECVSVKCPLHQFRPFQRSDGDEVEDAEA